MWTLGGMGERSVKSRELRNKEFASPSCGLYWRKCRHGAGERSRWEYPIIAHARGTGFISMRLLLSRLEVRISLCQGL